MVHKWGVLAVCVGLLSPINAAEAGAVPAAKRMDVRVLVLDDQQGQVGTFADRLKREGVQTTVVDVSVNHDPITRDFLVGTDAKGEYGKFSAVVVQTDYPAELNGDELTALADYELEYGARELLTYTWAHPEVGVSYAENPGYTGVLDGMKATVTAAAKTIGFGYLRGPVEFADTDGSSENYGSIAKPLDTYPAGQSYIPVVTMPIPDSAATGTVLGVFNDNGRERMVSTFSLGSWQAEFQILAPGMINWLTRGVATSYNRNYFSIHSDDHLLPDGRWSIEGNCTIGSDCDETAYPPDAPDATIRMTGADVDALVAWQKASGIKIEMAYNGHGHTDWVKAGNTDTQLQRLRANRSQLRFINHTWSHLYLGCVQNWDVSPWACVKTASGATKWLSKRKVNAQIRKNVDFARRNGFPINRREMVSGEHSGLKVPPQMPTDSPNFASALTRQRIQWTASDSSMEGPVVRRVGAAYTVPRHPMNIFYNVATKQEEVDEYNWIYTSRADGGSGICDDNPATTTCIEPLDLNTGFDDYIVPIETRIAFSHVINNDPRPHYVHQGNLTEDKIIYPVLDAVVADYRRTFSTDAPLQNLRMSQTGRLMLAMQRWTDGGSKQIRAQWVGRTLTLTNTGSRAVKTPVTVPLGSTRAGVAFGQAWGGSRSAWVSVPAGRTVTIRLR